MKSNGFGRVASGVALIVLAAASLADGGDEQLSPVEGNTALVRPREALALNILTMSPWIQPRRVVVYLFARNGNQGD